MVRRSLEAVWVVLLVGWLAGEALSSLRSHRSASLPASAPPAPDPARAPPRELRRLPGIGESRAIAVARARWEHPDDGPRLHLSDVPGIGPVSERAVREWLQGPRAP